MKVIIIGGGQTGAHIAGILLANKCEVTVIENRENIIQKLKKDIPEKNILFGNGTDPNVLEQAGIAKADVVAAVTGADDTNLVAATIARFEFDVPRVIARVNNPKNAWLFNAGMGVDVAINQADLLAVVNNRNLALVRQQDSCDMRARLAAADDDDFHLISPVPLTEGQARA